MNLSNITDEQVKEEGYHRPSDRLVPGDIFQVEVLDEGWTNGAFTVNQPENTYVYKDDTLTFLRRELSKTNTYFELKFFLSSSLSVITMNQDIFVVRNCRDFESSGHMFSKTFWYLKKVS